jgi:protein-tyrosine phosphatase
MMKNILVLCIGNICRSPMAAGMLEHALPGRTVRSAGISALIGKPADPFSVQLMTEAGIDITTHRAQQISQALVTEADLIFVMDAEQKNYVESRYIGARGKVFRLAESKKADIPDPYREGIESFRSAQQLIADGVQFWSERIRQMD